MRLTTLIVVAGLALTSTATAHNLNANTTFAPETIVSYMIPGTDYRGLDAHQPEPSEPPYWDETDDDTADTFDELERQLQDEELDAHSEVHFEQDLNNDVHAPLLEDSSFDPSEFEPVDRDLR